MYLVDTNILIDALKARRARLEFLQRLSRSQPLAFCSVIVAELFAGFAHSSEIAQARSDLLDAIVYVAPSESAAELAGSLQHQYKRRGISLSLNDVMIAAVAISDGHTLVTDNVKHFPMPELTLMKAPEASER
jgi:predicted nucleic acid-binding protein